MFVIDSNLDSVNVLWSLLHYESVNHIISVSVQIVVVRSFCIMP